MELERDDMQGMLLSAYVHLPWSANILAQIDDKHTDRARAWLGGLADTITAAVGKHDHRGTNVAFTHAGLKKLGIDDERAAFPIAFVDGMASERRARILGDDGPSAPECWAWGTGSNAVDVLLMLFAHREAALEEALTTHRAALESAGLKVIATLRSQQHADRKEHFGFSDGIAQPRLRVAPRGDAKSPQTNGSNDVAAGEFILGYPNEYGLTPQLPLRDDGQLDFGRNGSYLVVRQLQQDVAKFWRFLDSRTRGPNGGNLQARELLAAKLLGRWPSGTPIVKAPHVDNPALAKDNDFGFDDDRDGLLCPVGAHIRRANPRDGFAQANPQESIRRSNRHRILRRGRPYGPRLADPQNDDGAARGLIFMCFNSDIERQFEFVHQTWLNNATFSGLANEVDPLIGSQFDDAWMTIPSEPIRRRIKGLERFVTALGGAYFFMPSLRAIRYLAAGAVAPGAALTTTGR